MKVVYALCAIVATVILIFALPTIFFSVAYLAEALQALLQGRADERIMHNLTGAIINLGLLAAFFKLMSIAQKRARS